MSPQGIFFFNRKTVNRGLNELPCVFLIINCATLKSRVKYNHFEGVVGGVGEQIVLLIVANRLLGVALVQLHLFSTPVRVSRGNPLGSSFKQEAAGCNRCSGATSHPSITRTTLNAAGGVARREIQRSADSSAFSPPHLRLRVR